MYWLIISSRNWYLLAEMLISTLGRFWLGRFWLGRFWLGRFVCTRKKIKFQCLLSTPKNINKKMTKTSSRFFQTVLGIELRNRKDSLPTVRRIVAMMSPTKRGCVMVRFGFAEKEEKREKFLNHVSIGLHPKSKEKQPRLGDLFVFYWVHPWVL